MNLGEERKTLSITLADNEFNFEKNLTLNTVVRAILTRLQELDPKATSLDPEITNPHQVTIKFSLSPLDEEAEANLIDTLDEGIRFEEIELTLLRILLDDQELYSAIELSQQSQA